MRIKLYIFLLFAINLFAADFYYEPIWTSGDSVVIDSSLKFISRRINDERHRAGYASIEHAMMDSDSTVTDTVYASPGLLKMQPGKVDTIYNKRFIRGVSGFKLEAPPNYKVDWIMDDSSGIGAYDQGFMRFDNCTDIVIDGGEYDGNANVDVNTQFCHGFIFWECKRIIIRNAYIHDWGGDGITLVNCQDVLIENCIIEIPSLSGTPWVGRNCVSVVNSILQVETETKHLIIRGNSFYQGAPAGIDIEFNNYAPGYDMLVANNTFEGTGGNRGLAMENDTDHQVKNVIIANNTINNYSFGMTLGGSANEENYKIVDNIISNSGTYGIWLNYLENAEIHGNVIDRSGGDGIYCANGSNLSIKLNKITRSGLYGLRVITTGDSSDWKTSSNDFVISDNILGGNSTVYPGVGYGMYLGGLMRGMVKDNIAYEYKHKLYEPLKASAGAGSNYVLVDDMGFWAVDDSVVIYEGGTSETKKILELKGGNLGSVADTIRFTSNLSNSFTTSGKIRGQETQGSGFYFSSCDSVIVDGNWAYNNSVSDEFTYDGCVDLLRGQNIAGTNLRFTFEKWQAFLPAAADTVPSLTAALVGGEFHSNVLATGASDYGFMRLSAGGGTNVNTKAAIDLNGYGGGSQIRFYTEGVEKARIYGAGYYLYGMYLSFNDTNTQIWEDGSGNLFFKDANAGSKYLSSLLTSTMTVGLQIDPSPTDDVLDMLLPSGSGDEFFKGYHTSRDNSHLYYIVNQDGHIYSPKINFIAANYNAGVTGYWEYNATYGILGSSDLAINGDDLYIDVDSNNWRLKATANGLEVYKGATLIITIENNGSITDEVP